MSRVEGLDRVLDDCLDRLLMSGQPVEECVAAHPQRAAELEGYLQAIGRLAAVGAGPVGEGAKSRGRQLLHEEWRSLEEQGRRPLAPRRMWPARISGWPRLAVAGAAAWLLVVLAGAGAVTASSNNLPGDALYGLKLGGEHARLALAFSSQREAILHLEFAGRRVGEITSLVRRGDLAQAKSLQEKLAIHLAAASLAMASVENPDARAALRWRVEAEASLGLEALQAAVLAAPAPLRESMTVILSGSGEAYSAAVEQAAALHTPDRYPASRQGMVLIQISGSTHFAPERLLIGLAGLDVYGGEGEAAGWKPLVGEAQTIDLVAEGKAHELIVRGEVDAGVYTRLRLRLAKVTAVIGGQERQSSWREIELALARPFRVEEATATAIGVDLDVERLLQMGGPRDHLVTPILTMELRGVAPKDGLSAPTPAPALLRLTWRGRWRRSQTSLLGFFASGQMTPRP